jgi:hypothetical protein
MWAGLQLPAHQQLPDHNELRRGESLGENVGALFQSIDVLGFNALFLANVGAEEVVLEGQVLVAWGHLGDIDQRQATLIVLKHSRSNQTVLDECKVQLGSNLLEQGPHGEQLPHGHAEGHVLSSSGGQADLILQLGGPQDGAATQGEYKPSPGLDRGWVLVILILV